MSGEAERTPDSGGDRPVAELHPLLVHHIVNSLGWPSLRPLQQAAVSPILTGEHALLVAPTAGGKTEAAIFPLLSRMLEEEWRGLSVLYLCPLRALLNNLHPRIEEYAQMVGRQAGLWHGDVGESAREAIRDDAPDILLTTPESIEAMLISRRTEHEHLFRGVRALVVDEIHAFAGDDRGWHLMAVAERVQRLAQQPIQRIGLSATIGNAGEILGWLTRTSPGSPQRVIRPPEVGVRAQPPEVTVDFVGEVDNAATVISRMHRGEKRLVFVDSRARVESLAAALRDRDVRTFVSHGSLGREERHAAEAAFAEARDCVIVSTSTLELGIDVGDLDRVIQIDAPPSVASFLQRLGRTGRREGRASNTLFLSTRDDAFICTLGLLNCWEAGYVEPLEPSALPLHLVVQQVMALVLQEQTVGAHTWMEWLGKPFVLGDDVEAHVPALTAALLAQGFLHQDQGILAIGKHGEETFGGRHFMELMAVFSEPPMFTVLAGRRELGKVPLRLFTLQAPEGHVLLLAGQDWFVRDVDWRRGVVHVEPADRRGKVRWFGEGRGLSFEVAQGTRSVLAGAQFSTVSLSNRARTRLNEVRDDFSWLTREPEFTIRRSDTGEEVLWTFAGATANAWLSAGLGELTDQLLPDDFGIRLVPNADPDVVRHVIRGVEPGALTLSARVAEGAKDRLKFAEALPDELALKVVEERMRADAVLEAMKGWGVRRVVSG